ncbi:hypothetical protein [Epilithonimonas hominis]|uniref:hypothetical protein n=1 Tax=Epilithonimonas hominis TaxID=420404 RepID=UPI000EC2C101|nr:hypothetical protein [Epilithonimonas hominis]HAP95841.1 hypothetical protein [Chryseobacterium sp.]
MAWQVIEHKCNSNQQELSVKILIKEMATNTYATYAEQFENHFKILVREIPRKNNFSADLLYKVTQRNLKSIEVWKLDVEGNYKYKMFTLNFIEN